MSQHLECSLAMALPGYESVRLPVDAAALLAHVAELVSERHKLRQLAAGLEEQGRETQRVHVEIQGLLAAARKAGCDFAGSARVVPTVVAFLEQQAGRIEELEELLAEAQKERDDARKHLFVTQEEVHDLVAQAVS